MFELLFFTLAGAVSTDEFLAADAAFQQGFAYQQRGLVRRTTAQGDGDWLVISMWESHESADAAAAAESGHPVAEAFNACIDAGSRRAVRYVGLDG